METTSSSRLIRVMREALGKRANRLDEEGAESGFTLIELMVVLLIMAILLAIAIPTFLGVKSGAQDRSAQSDLTNALTSAKAVFTAAGGYPQIASGLISTLHSTEPELTFTTGALPSAPYAPHTISVAVASDGNGLLLAEFSQDGRCWYAEDNEEGSAILPTGLTGGSTSQGVTYEGTTAGATGITCNASAISASLSNGGTWTTSYPA
jgi:type IV pilus assembly protein PilA